MKPNTQAGIWKHEALLRGASGVSSVSKAPRFQLYEYAFYGILSYGALNSTLGIVIPGLGSLGLTALAALCLLRLGSSGSALTTYQPLFRIFLCIGFFSFIQYYVHGESLADQRYMIVWAERLIIIQALYTRPGFLHRFMWAIFAVGLMVLPFLDLRGGDRAGLDTPSGLSNPNDLAAWFGFCAVAFSIKALETRRLLTRIVSVSIVVLSLVVVGLTVSRSALVAIALAFIVALRKQLKRGFVPLLILVLVGGVVFSLGLFDHAIARYTERGAEETGRGMVFPVALQRFLNSPLAGVGMSRLATDVGQVKPTNPHNSFLFISLGGGIVPLGFFLLHLWKAFRGALKRSSRRAPYSDYVMPLFAYCAFFLLVHDSAYMESWFVASFGACLVGSSPRRRRRNGRVQRRILNNQHRQALAPRVSG